MQACPHRRARQGCDRVSCAEHSAPPPPRPAGCPFRTSSLRIDSQGRGPGDFLGRAWEILGNTAAGSRLAWTPQRPPDVAALAARAGIDVVSTAGGEALTDPWRAVVAVGPRNE